MKTTIKNFLIGIALGIANIIPGISGGTMAVVTGVYSRLIGVFTLDFKFIKKNARFVITMVLGILLGIFAFSGVVKYLLNTYPLATNSFFVGVVLGTCPFIYKRTVARQGLSIRAVLPCALTVGIMVALVIWESTYNQSPEAIKIISTLSVGNFFILFGTMILTSACMIIPGISGSFIALALGVYPSLINALSTFNIMLLIPIVLGMVVGLVGGAKLIKMLLAKFYVITYSAILGLLIGSVMTLIYPLLPMIYEMAADKLVIQLIFAVVMFAVGTLLAIFFAKNEGKNIKNEDPKTDSSEGIKDVKDSESKQELQEGK